MTADERLKQALSLGPAEPPAFDVLFAARVVERIERRRFLLGLVVMALWAAAGAVLIWVLRPVLGEAAAPVVPFLAPAVVLGLAVWLALRTDLGRAARRLRRLPRPMRF